MASLFDALFRGLRGEITPVTKESKEVCATLLVLPLSSLSFNLTNRFFASEALETLTKVL